ncbi:MAG: extracellular solute-binding protein family 1 [Eubacterium sp.]|nr:extracellular solute-binding protein family 1 [Eubacterium sp.]
MKRVISLILSAVIISTLCIGCGNSSNSTNSSGTGKGNTTGVELRYSRWGLPEEMNGTKKMIEAFQKENPNIKVKLENSSWEEYWQKLQTQIASNSAPDVFLLDAGWYLKQFAPKGIIKDITPLMEKDKVNKDQYYDVWKTFTYENKIFAMPRDINSLVLFYNKDLFKKAGITEYPDGNMTWDELAKLAQKLTIDDKGRNATDPDFDIKNAVQYGLHVNTPDTDALIETLIWQNGGKLMSEDGKECYLDKPEAREVLQYLHDLTWKYKVKLSPAAAQKYDQNWLQTGKFAMVYQGSWMMSTLSDATFDWDVTVPPNFGDKIYCVQSVGNAIMEKSKHQDEAWELVKFLSGKEGQTIMAEQNDAIPVLKDTAENVYLKAEGKPANKKAIFDVSVKSVPYIDFPSKGEIFDSIKIKLEPYLNNQVDMDKAIQDALDDVKRIQGKN